MSEGSAPPESLHMTSVTLINLVVVTIADVLPQIELGVQHCTGRSRDGRHRRHNTFEDVLHEDVGSCEAVAARSSFTASVQMTLPHGAQGSHTSESSTRLPIPRTSVSLLITGADEQELPHNPNIPVLSVTELRTRATRAKNSMRVYDLTLTLSLLHGAGALAYWRPRRVLQLTIPGSPTQAAKGDEQAIESNRTPNSKGTNCADLGHLSPETITGSSGELFTPKGQAEPSRSLQTKH
ncbi:hypothetical protein FIBSPDRAFT_974186 [Athelia psychrophila]|uniref:Uncharacterized protein n=1 Tax=Athelia psychrophila TaxID=1759441 RepID=A0A166FPQ4_9AGAM|nr:hypothetical protein FIBSPDRAFT_974186 [Fibularhizoctonia sp. CBS 109695]